MRLISARVTTYRNIVDSTDFTFSDSVTCLLGKNESGKTALLMALYSLSPAHPNTVELSTTLDYPRWRKVRDSRTHSLEDTKHIHAEFSLNKEEIGDLRRILNDAPLPEDLRVQAEMTYSEEQSFALSAEESAWLEAAKTIATSSSRAKDILRSSESLESLSRALDAVDVKKSTREGREIGSVKESIDLLIRLSSGGMPTEVVELIQERMPVFFYYGQYDGLEGRIDLDELFAKAPAKRNGSDETAISLLSLAGVEKDAITQPEFEERIAQIEAASSEITTEVFRYWKTNKDLAVQFSVDTEERRNGQGVTVSRKYLDIRLFDVRHRSTTNFSRRSTGFQWFFSFVAAFSSFYGENGVVILLDEPGLGLHAKAQEDLLQYIEDRLVPEHQVIFTTHSPFMVNPRKLERVRVVQDISTRDDPDIGAKVSENLYKVGRDTLFPMQAALGYDLAQTLFVGPYNLLVEGPSDLIYLSVFQDHLKDIGRESLDGRFVIVPVGGADKLPTFVALLHAQLNVTVLVDGLPDQHKRLVELVSEGVFEQDKLVGIQDIAHVSRANVEDLFSPEEYLRLYNSAFGTTVSLPDLKGQDSIVERIRRYMGSRDFSHLKPATRFLRARDEEIGRISDDTISRFETLFQRLNATIG